MIEFRLHDSEMNMLRQRQQREMKAIEAVEENFLLYEPFSDEIGEYCFKLSALCSMPLASLACMSTVSILAYRSDLFATALISLLHTDEILHARLDSQLKRRSLNTLRDTLVPAELPNTNNSRLLWRTLDFDSSLK